METINAIGKYENKYSYYNEFWKKRLKKACEFRKMTQTKLASLVNKSQNSVNKWLSLPGTNPSIADFLIVCDILKIDIRYFHDRFMEIEAADLTKKGKRKINFIPTSVTNQLFSRLDSITNSNFIYTIYAYPQSGISTALMEYTKAREDCIVIQTTNDIFRNTVNTVSNLIFDNLMNDEIIKNIIPLAGKKTFIFILQKNKMDIHERSLLSLLRETFHLDHFDSSDIDNIINASVSHIPDDIRKTIHQKTMGRIDYLFALIKKYRNKLTQ